MIGPEIERKLVEAMIELKHSDIDGCITGSMMMDAPVSTWSTVPDIDIFVYSRAAQVHAIDYLEMKLGYVPGGKDKNQEGESIKREWIMEGANSKKNTLSTIMLQRNGVYVNITWKKNVRCALDVISHFDMSIVMIGYDIKSRHVVDLRPMFETPEDVAVHNWLKPIDEEHPSRFDVWRALRQWDRIPKYYERGYDTRPVAQYYLDLINKVLEIGAAFSTANDIANFEQMEPEFIEVRNKIAKWLEEHKED